MALKIRGDKKMIQLKYEQLDGLLKTIVKMQDFEFNNITVCFKMYSLYNFLTNKNSELITFREKLQKKYFIYKENGVSIKDGNPELNEGKVFEDYINELRELFSMEFDCPFDKFLKPENFEGQKISISDIAVLQPFIVE